MSIVQLRIELPTYAHSFSIHVPDTYTILEVKKEISRICPGQPCVDGQKLIWRGRFLADNEQVDTIWKSPSEPRIVHLSVHPSSWISGPPTVQSSNIPPTILKHTPMISVPAFQSHPKSPLASSTATERLPFVFAKHVEAITVLMEGRLNPAGTNAISGLREDAVNLLEYNGWGWPAALDEPYPEVTLGGLKYERITAEEVPFLSLVNEGAQPTPAQAQALRVLGYTFSIFMKEFRQGPQSNVNVLPAQAIPNHRIIPEIPHINDLLQQMGLPPLRNVHNAEVVPNQEQGRAPNLLPDVAIRPLLAPLFMLIVRASLLLYLVAPTRKPIFAVLIIAWMLYEIWQPIRNHLLRHLQENEQDAGQPEARAPAQADAPSPDDPSAQPRSMRELVEALGNINLEAEQEVLAHATLENEDPLAGRRIGTRIGQTIGTFIVLAFMTLHPAIWNHRRVVLRLREEAIRTEVRNGTTLDQTDVEDGDSFIEREGQLIQAFRERHFQRPRWIQRYIERVVNNDWDE